MLKYKFACIWNTILIFGSNQWEPQVVKFQKRSGLPEWNKCKNDHNKEDQAVNLIFGIFRRSKVSCIYRSARAVKKKQVFLRDGFP